MKRGYLVFTTHEDELDATFLPETPENTAFFNQLKACAPSGGWGANDLAARLWNRSDFSNPIWNIDADWGSNCQSWPFNDMEIIETFFLMIY